MNMKHSREACSATLGNLDLKRMDRRLNLRERFQHASRSQKVELSIAFYQTIPILAKMRGDDICAIDHVTRETQIFDLSEFCVKVRPRRTIDTCRRKTAPPMKPIIPGVTTVNR